MSVRITKTFVDKVPIPDEPDGKPVQAFYRDNALPGFALRVNSGGSKSFIVETRINNKVKRLTLGRYGKLTVEQARNQAKILLGDIVSGKDPVAEKKAKLAKTVTLQEAFDDYLLAKKNLRPSTIHDYNRSIEGALSDWRKKALRDITKDMVEIRHRELGEKSHSRANNTFRFLRAIFNYAISRYEDAKGNPIITLNPVARLSQIRAWYHVPRKQTLIKPHQLKGWYEATMQLSYETTRDYIHFVLFTGLRRSEASQLTWDNVDFDEKTITILITKNHRVHVLPFSDFLEDLLQRRFEESLEIDRENGNYVFPGASLGKPLIEPKTALKKVVKLSGVTFTLHDLRRTFITIAESLDIPSYALKRLLNHKDPNDVTAGYIVFDVNRLRDPMQIITSSIKESIGI